MQDFRLNLSKKTKVSAEELIMTNRIGIGGTLAGFGAGLTAMYFLDPDRGARRRAIVSSKFVHAAKQLPRAARVTRLDLSNRAKGVLAETSHFFKWGEEQQDDGVTVARIRSKMGRINSHPHAVNIQSRNGEVTLSGVILKDEVPALIKCIKSVSGVREIHNNLHEYDSPEGVSSLQGGSKRESRWEFFQENWSPAARFAAGTAGTAALAYGLAKRDAGGLGIGALGAALLARSVTNTEFQRLFGFGGGRTAVTIDKSINVNAPPDVLYALWSNFENFPQFMSNVLEVTNIDDKISHWKVAGPGNIPVEWDAEITKVVPDEIIAWKSVKGSAISNAGYVMFEPNDDGTTEVTVRLSYNPPAGAVGHALAMAFGADPKSEMDADLMRMKSLLETGALPHDAAEKPQDWQTRQTIH
jgi:uncharacterized membrane protein